MTAKKRIPSMAEREAAAVRLGLIEPGQPLTPRLQRKMADILATAEEIEADDAARAQSTTAFVAPITTTYAALVEAGLPDHAAAQVVAAIAPAIWRTNQGAAHARH